MTDTSDTLAIEQLRAFAYNHGELQFGHMCTDALNGEEWARKRVTAVLQKIQSVLPADLKTEDALDVIRSTDTTRPDGAVSRGGIEIT